MKPPQSQRKAVRLLVVVLPFVAGPRWWHKAQTTITSVPGTDDRYRSDSAQFILREFQPWSISNILPTKGMASSALLRRQYKIRPDPMGGAGAYRHAKRQAALRSGPASKRVRDDRNRRHGSQTRMPKPLFTGNGHAISRRPKPPSPCQAVTRISLRPMIMSRGESPPGKTPPPERA